MPLFAAYFLLCSVSTLAAWRWTHVGWQELLVLALLHTFALGALAAKRSRIRPAIMALIISATWFSVHYQQQDKAIWPRAKHGDTVAFVGTVSALVEHKNTSKTQTAKGLAKVEFTTSQLHPTQTVRLNWHNPPTLAVGQRWQLEAKLFQPRGFRNVGGFNFRLWMLQHSIHASGYVKSGERIGQEQYPLTQARETLRQRFYTIHPEAAPLLSALVLGDRTGLSSQQWQSLQQTGTGHLFSISGLHVGIVAMLALWLTRLIWRSERLLLLVPRPYVAAIAAFLAALTYAAIAGFSVPTIRALVMISTLSATTLLSRRTSITSSLSIGLILVLLIQPLAVMTAGFWLSFIAVAMLIWVLAGHWPQRPWWKSLLIAQLAMSVGLAPITSYFFGVQSIVAPVANLVLIPLFSLVVVPLSFIGTLCLALGLETPLWLAGELLQHILKTLEWLAALSPYSSVANVVTSAGVAALATLGAFVLFAPRGLGWFWRSIGLLLFAPIFVTPQTDLKPSEYTITMFDVGHGLSVLVQTKDHALLFDTGGRFRSGATAADLAIIPAMRHLGGPPLQTIVLSHDDLDHTGGHTAIQRQFNPGRTFTSDRPDKDKSGNDTSGNSTCTRQQWTWNDVHFAFIQPLPADNWGDNNRSCVLLIRNQHTATLLTGDIETAAEKRLLKEGLLKDSLSTLGAIAIMTVPHHGSKSSSHPAFVQKLRPRYALASTGYGNHWGFPRETVVKRYHAAGSTLLNTAEVGMIRLKVNRQGDIFPYLLPPQD